MKRSFRFDIGLCGSAHSKTRRANCHAKIGTCVKSRQMSEWHLRHFITMNNYHKSKLFVRSNVRTSFVSGEDKHKIALTYIKRMLDHLTLQWTGFPHLLFICYKSKSQKAPSRSWKSGVSVNRSPIVARTTLTTIIIIVAHQIFSFNSRLPLSERRYVRF